MRILLHDFAGYPFPIELSREMARRGHEVMHAYCGSIRTTPGGELVELPGDPASLLIDRILLSEPLQKYSFVKRRRQEIEFGKLIRDRVDRFRPDVVVSGNAPLDTQIQLQRRCKRLEVPFVFWLQDLLSIAADRLLRKKIPVVGGLVGQHYKRLESKMLRESDLCILITEDFAPLLKQWGVSESAMTVIQNWAPLASLPMRPKDNPWARKHGLHDKITVIYSGTMGMKHNPRLLLDVAKAARDQPDIQVVVVSSGMGADWLRAAAAEDQLNNLLVLDFVPSEEVPDVFGTADILAAVLESDAGAFSVPSKVLAYLCAGKPLTLAIPPENLAAQIVQRLGAGLIVPPDDVKGFVENTMSLINDPERRAEMGHSARQYAETTFDLEKITDTFLRELNSVVQA